MDSLKIAKLKRAHQEFFKTNKNQKIKSRINYLKKLKRVIDVNENLIFEALHKDLKKPIFESFASEILMIQKEIDFFTKNLKALSAPVKVSGSLINFPSQDYIISEPYGNILMISPWNYPFQLALVPLIGAIAAGNTVILKPSESAPHTSKILKGLLSKVFPKGMVSVVEGDAKVAQELLKEQWDYIFFTGSTVVGKIVARAAANFLTPITLELGGKSPCIVDGTTPLKKTARRIVWGKFLNCGQTCIAPDYILVKSETKESLVKSIIIEIENAFGSNVKNSKDYGRIIHKKHFEKLENDLKGQSILYGGIRNKNELFFGPTIVDNPKINSLLIKEEIFGPILPILSYNNLEDLDSVLSLLKNPLAFYVFSNNEKFIAQLIKDYSFGGAVINDSLIHFSNQKLPFGGIGNSGIGSYHAEHSFKLFSHKKSIVKRPFWFDLPQRYPPYPKSLGIIKRILKQI